MATIRTSCSFCGDLELKPAQMSLHIYENALERSYYRFDCPECAEPVVKPADQQIIDLLLTAEAAGLKVERVVIPAEALEEHVGWIITNDDCLDFALSLRELEYPVAAIVGDDDRLRPTA